LPAGFGTISPETRTPIVALMLTGGGILVFALSLPLEDLAHFADTVLLLDRDKSSYVPLIREGEGEDHRSKTNDHIIVATETVTASRKVENHGWRAAATEKGSDLTLPVEDPLIQKITERKKEVTIYDIQGDPFFEDVRDLCEHTIKQLGYRYLCH